jgi:hypothetical protein
MVGTVKSFPGGPRAACLTAFVSLAALLLSGCGTHVAGSAANLPGAGSATTGAMAAGAQLGLVWVASDSTLRPLIGVPGAVRLGDPLFAPGSWKNAAWSAASQTALLLDAKGNLQMMALPSLQPSTVTSGVASGATMTFSPRGRYAVVFSAGASSLLLLGGLPQQVTVATIHAGGALRGAAVSDQGAVAVAIAASGGGASVVSIAPGGTRSTLASIGGFGGLSFVPGSDDLLFSDSMANILTRIHSGTAVTLATQTSGLNQPLAVAVSADARWAVTANRANGTLVRVDLTGATQPARSTCQCSPAEMLPLTGNALFELAAPNTGPGWMIEADDAASRVLFIPPARSGQ